MRAIIIGAGKGRRLLPSTASSPKCFTEIRGKRILDWILDALTGNGIENICFIGGYLMDEVREAYPRLTFRHNEDWEHNNILASLMYARDLMDGPFISTYCDILYTPEIVRGLVEAEADIAVGVDTEWREHYRQRTQHPSHDAEKATAADGLITGIGRGIDPEKAYGEFIGVAKFSARGAAQLKAHYDRARRIYAGKPFREAPVFEKAFLIQLLQEMVEAGVPMAHVDTPGNYREIDTLEDLELARKYWGA